MIVFTMTESTRSGLLRISTAGGSSEPVFITNTAELPVPQAVGAVRIDDIQPRTAQIGTIVRIVGDGFGPPTGLSTISLQAPVDTRAIDGGDRWIASWTDQVIEVLLPPDLPTGIYEIRINDAQTGQSLEVGPPSGRSEIGDSQRYTLSQGVVVSGVTEDARAVVPIPFQVVGQGAGRLLRESAESIDSITEGSVVYSFSPSPDVASEKESSGEGSSDEEPKLLDRIERVDLVERYSVLWQVDDDIDSRVFLEPAFREAFFDLLEPDVMNPDLAQRIETIRREDIDLSDDAFSIIRSIYNSVTTRLEPGEGGATDLGIALDGTASAAAYADLAAALGRLAGIPTRRNYGVLLLDTGETVPHRWVEFFVPQVGWIAADPAIGDGAYENALVSLRSFYEVEDEYRGYDRIDNRRITLAVDGRSSARVYPGAAAAYPSTPYTPNQYVEFPAVSLPTGFGSRWEVPTLSPQFN